MRVVVVGICGSGKTILAQGLRQLGHEVRECHQEHSQVPYMWRVISRPDVLVYLDASAAVAEQRGLHHYVQGCVEEQRRRLAHARAYCDLYLLTDGLTQAQVLTTVAEFLAQRSPNAVRNLTPG